MRQYVLLILIITSSIFCQNVPYQFRDVGIENKINAVLTNNLYFTDEYDQTVILNELINQKPTIINFVYLNCPLLCHLLLDGIKDIVLRSNYALSDDYQIISISIDPNETSENLIKYSKKYNDQQMGGSGWFFLKGDKTTINELTQLFGFNYKYIERTNDYAHPSVLFFYNQRLTNYLEGMTFDKQMFDYSIMSTKTTQSFKEKVVTFCYFFDPDSQTYSFYIMNIMRAACLLTVLIIGMVILKIYLKEKRYG